MSRTFSLALRFSLREMRGGVSGFLVFIACIALGVGAIGGVNSVAQAITGAVSSQGQTLLGGDIRFELNQRETTEAELGFLRGFGDVAASANMRSMARLPDGSDQALVEVKATDDAYPLIGELVTEPRLPRADLFGNRNGAWGAVAPQLLLDRLNVKMGDRLMVGSQTFELRALLVTEPDAVSDGFGFAPRLMVSLEGLRASGLIQPGALVEHAYKIRLPAGASDARLGEIRELAATHDGAASVDVRAASMRRPAGRYARAPTLLPRCRRMSSVFRSSSRSSASPRSSSAASASPMRCAPISTPSAASLPPSRASARPAISL